MAFQGLVGRDAPIADADMTAFGDFILQVVYPPNPIRNLDDSNTPDQAEALDFFNNVPNSQFLDPATKCGDCHLLDPTANAQYGVDRPGLFGTDGKYSNDLITQILKIPHLRNQYQKVGMFGNPDFPNGIISGNNGDQGDQVRGFGFFHDGSVDTDFRFVSALFFAEIPGVNPIGIPITPAGDVLRRKLEDLMLAFPSNMKPIVGQQITLSAGSPASVGARIDLLEQRAAAGDCDLVAKTRQGSNERGYLYANGSFLPDKAAHPAVSDASLRAHANGPGRSVTFTCVPPGSGLRIALDRDLDGTLDGDE